MAKAKVKEIVITRVEGLIKDCGKPKTVSDFHKANQILRLWSDTAPKGGCYDKCDFKITFDDGSVYEGRYDLKHWKDEVPNLGNHVRDFVTFMAGQRKPGWMTDEQWKKALNSFEKERPHYLDYLNTHDLSDAQSE